MEVVIVFITILLVPVLFTVLADSLGPAFRSPIRIDEHAIAATRTTPSYTMRPSTTSNVTEQAARLSLRRFPTLHVIDQLRGSGAPAFASDLHASQLEQRARQLTDDYWSEGVWLTGAISPAQLNAVVTRLEADRQEFIDKVQIVTTQEPSLPSTAALKTHQA